MLLFLLLIDVVVNVPWEFLYCECGEKKGNMPEIRLDETQSLLCKKFDGRNICDFKAY